MSWKLELGPAPQGLNVKRKKSWWRTMTTIEPFRAAGFCAAPPHPSARGLTGHD